MLVMMTPLRPGALVTLIVIAVACSACGSNESAPPGTVAAPQDSATTSASIEADSGIAEVAATTTAEVAATTTAASDADSDAIRDTTTTTAEVAATTAVEEIESSEAGDATTAAAADGAVADDATTTTAVEDAGSGVIGDATTAAAADGAVADDAATTTTGDADNGAADDVVTTIADADGGSADDSVQVTAPPAGSGFDPFYEKYVDLEGLPIIASEQVADEALRQARRLLSEMLTNRRDVLATLAANNVRVAIMAESSGITELPELSDLYEAFPDIDWDNRTRGGGVGPTLQRPVLAIAEENLLCYSTDLFPYEDIFVHEAAHAVLNMGIEQQAGGAAFRQRLERAYQNALDDGLWHSTYAAENPDEYWAEGIQSWFDVNDPPGPIHNEINTRRELREYDPALAALVEEALGDVSVSTSCHGPGTHPQAGKKILGRMIGPDGDGVGGVLLWAWSGQVSTSGSTVTQADGSFAIAVPDGSFTLDIHADPFEGCTFVGRYGPDGFTTVRESATLVVVDGADISRIEIVLPQELDDLPFIEWCA